MPYKTKEKKNNYVVVIPARYKSSRLKGKPLINLKGIPIIVRTYRQCLKAVSSDLSVYVNTFFGDDILISSKLSMNKSLGE